MSQLPGIRISFLEICLQLYKDGYCVCNFTLNQSWVFENFDSDKCPQERNESNGKKANYTFYIAARLELNFI